jgi:heme exporter protein CcmD
VARPYPDGNRGQAGAQPDAGEGWSMSDFLFQGGYGFYVWSAYAVSVLGVGFLIVSTLAAWRKAKRALDVLQDSETNF